MRIALPTCRNLPSWEVDDAPLHQALQDRGCEVERPVWDDATVNWSRYRACLVRTTWDYQEKRAQFVKWARRVASVTPIFNSADIIQWNTNKRYLLDLRDRGIGIAPTIWLEPGQPVDIKELVRHYGWSKAFLKPAVGATARETFRVDDSSISLADAQRNLDRLLASEAMMLQPYLASVETEGELSAVFFDETFSHAVRKIPVPGDYRVQDDFGASDEPVTLTRAEIETAERCIQAVAGRQSDPLLYARADFLRGPEGEFWLNELELVEPSLFFRHCSAAADRLAQALIRRID